MLNAQQFKALKKANISIDAQKSKVRIPEAYKSATAQQKIEIKELGGLSHNNFYNVSNTGSASPRVVLSLSQVLDISPKYFTGEIDERESCDESLITEIFNQHSGNKRKPAKSKTAKKSIVKSKAAKTPKVAKSAKTTTAAKTAPTPAAAAPATTAPAKRVGRPRKTPAAPVAPLIPVPAPVAPPAQVPVPLPTPKAASPVRPITPIRTKSVLIDDASLVVLLNALAIRAKHNSEAAATYEAVKDLLVK